ncbi:MAG: hypothetical protein UX19_C0002G0058 [Candidatus Woesebacteria bacterium GW2011_GWA1_45_8]|uniref:Uncharacterized protein n=1 Tax=Candidatus Woesebacteria bacterium GW2011_GWA1_45_8 TaxID=1618559 RepID=A0A0G1MVL4_9BACT|nr:MAG: hypothetical protein UX19_C0002G0058 [Candidatus Woesebacteria bacterium GW2011_GWA1_45_8]
MLTKTLAKIDRYYPILVAVIVGLTILIIFSLRGIFTALNTASEFDPDLVAPSVKVEKARLDSVFDKIKNQKPPGLTSAP